MKLASRLLPFIIVLMTSCTPNQSKSSAPRPLGPDDLPIVQYFSDSEDLKNVPEEVMPANYQRYLVDPSSILDSIASKMTLPALQAWTRSLVQYPVTLEYHQYWRQGVKETQVVGFAMHEDVDAPLHSYQGPTVHLELVPPETIPDTIPVALQELYTLGKVWLFGFSASGFFFGPENLEPASQVEYLNEYLKEYKELGKTVPDDLIPFYTDSACWLMYDKEETVYCGGVECGNFWNSGLKIDTVVNTVFQRMLDKERLYIEAFAPMP